MRRFDEGLRGEILLNEDLKTLRSISETNHSSSIYLIGHVFRLKNGGKQQGGLLDPDWGAGQRWLPSLSYGIAVPRAGTKPDQPIGRVFLIAKCRGTRD